MYTHTLPTGLLVGYVTSWIFPKGIIKFYCSGEPKGIQILARSAVVGMVYCSRVPKGIQRVSQGA